MFTYFTTHCPCRALSEAGRSAGKAGSAACSDCAAGFTVAMEGATACAACSAGQFQSRARESSCELCASGKFSSDDASTSCGECPRGYSSAPGSASCAGQADKDYFLYQGVATECPKSSVCAGGTAMPHPLHGFWVDRRGLEFANDIYKCPRATCAPAEAQTTYLRLVRGLEPPDASLCWDMAAYTNGDGTSGSSCNSDRLLCKDGSHGALCGSCDNGFIYSSAERVCVACAASIDRVLALVGAAVGAALVGGAVYFSGAHHRLPACSALSWVMDIAREVDSGALRVAWANYQVNLLLLDCFLSVESTQLIYTSVNITSRVFAHASLLHYNQSLIGGVTLSTRRIKVNTSIRLNQ
jgi:hypothetical protein